MSLMMMLMMIGRSGEIERLCCLSSVGGSVTVLSSLVGDAWLKESEDAQRGVRKGSWMSLAVGDRWIMRN